METKVTHYDFFDNETLDMSQSLVSLPQHH